MVTATENGNFAGDGDNEKEAVVKSNKIAKTLGIDLAIHFTLSAGTSGPPSHSILNASDF